MKTKILFLTCLFLIPVIVARAGDVTLDVNADQLLTSTGTPMGQNGVVLLVVDTNNTGFGSLQAGASLSINSDITGTGDRIAGIFDLSVWGGNGAFENPSSSDLFNESTVTGWNAGDSLELVWLPTDTLSSTSLTAGTTYGSFSGPTGSLGESWITPQDGLGTTLAFYTQGGKTLGPGAFPDSDAFADKVVEGVPEPNTWALSLFGFGALLYVLRRKRAHL